MKVTPRDVGFSAPRRWRHSRTLVSTRSGERQEGLNLRRPPQSQQTANCRTKRQHALFGSESQEDHPCCHRGAIGGKTQEEGGARKPPPSPSRLLPLTVQARSRVRRGERT